MSKSENFDLELHFQFAFCILQVAFFFQNFSKFAIGEKRLFPIVFTKAFCNCDMSVCKSNIRVHLQY